MEVPLSPRPSLDTVSTVARRVLQHHLDSPFPFADEDCKAKIPVMTTTSAASATPANTLTGLARVFSNPRAWNVLDEDEKLEILSLIPPIFHPDTSITPIPPLDAEFLLYSTDWSGGVRQFEEDNGKLPLTYPPVKMKLDKMVGDGIFSIGETFTCRDKDRELALIVSLVQGSRIQFKHISGLQVVDIVGAKEVSGPKPLIHAAWNKVLGKPVNGRIGWDSVTCVRGGEVKTLQALRIEHYHSRYYWKK